VLPSARDAFRLIGTLRHGRRNPCIRVPVAPRIGKRLAK
jgi:hypothetical protein